MTRHATERVLVLLGVLVCVGVVAGCSASEETTTSGGREMMTSGPGVSTAALTCAAPATLPGTTVHVALADPGLSRPSPARAPLGARMEMRLDPTSVPAGEVSIVAENLGWRPHEVVVLPLTGGSAGHHRTPGAAPRSAHTGIVAQASATCRAGQGTGIQAGTAGWTTVRLSPGRYQLVSLMPNQAADGMRAELVVR